MWFGGDWVQPIKDAMLVVAVIALLTLVLR